MVASQSEQLAAINERLENISAGMQRISREVASLSRSIRGERAEGNRGVIKRLEMLEASNDTVRDEVDEIRREWRLYLRLFIAAATLAMFAGGAAGVPLSRWLNL